MQREQKVFLILIRMNVRVCASVFIDTFLVTLIMQRMMKGGGLVGDEN